MHPDMGIVKKVVEDLPYLLHVDGEVNVIGSVSFALMFEWNEGVL